MKIRKIIILGVLVITLLAGCGKVVLTGDDLQNDDKDILEKYEDVLSPSGKDDENSEVKEPEVTEPEIKEPETKPDETKKPDVDFDLDVNASTLKKTTSEELAAYQLIVQKFAAGEIKGNISSSSSIGAGKGSGVKMQIALTFDDGPYTEMTEKYIKVLDEYNVSATFFLQGTYIYSRPEYAQKIVEAGHEVGNHSWYHHDLSKKDEEFITNDFTKSNAIFEEVLGATPVLYRPAYGAYNKTVTKIAKSFGQTNVTWNVDTLDWKETDVEVLYNHIMKHGQSGAIILMHENKGITLEVLPRIIEDLQAKGYEFITVSEMIARSMENWEEEVEIAKAELKGETVEDKDETNEDVDGKVDIEADKTEDKTDKTEDQNVNVDENSDKNENSSDVDDNNSGEDSDIKDDVIKDEEEPKNDFKDDNFLTSIPSVILKAE